MYIHQEAGHTLKLHMVHCTHADFDTFFPLWWDDEEPISVMEEKTLHTQA